MFASQAALVIGNARKYRDEQRARADLETLINTSPVGVMVFDARTGVPVSINRESRRIMGNLQTPECPVEQLLDMVTFRRADGREIALAEFLGMVSHELRVPLSSIRGSATALLDASSDLDPAERQFLRIIVNQTDHMGELILLVDRAGGEG